MHCGAQMPNHTLRLQGVLQLLCGTCGQQQSQRPGRRIDHMYAVATEQQIISEFAADKTSAYDQHGFGRRAKPLVETRQVL